MKKRKKGLKRITAIALAMLMVCSTIDMSVFTVFAAEGTQIGICENNTEHTDECSYVLEEDATELDGTVELGDAVLLAVDTYDFSTSQSVLTINSSNLSTYDNATITGSYTLALQSDILVIDGVTVNLTIDNLTLTTTGTTTNGYSPIDLRNNATLNLTVKGTNTLSAEFHAAGIHVPEGCTLNITSASTEDIACGSSMKISITGGAVTADGNIGYGKVSVGNAMTGGSVTIGKQLYPVTLTFFDDTKFATDTDYAVNDLTVTIGGNSPADGTIMATLPNTIEYHSASMGTMVIWLVAGTYNISVTAADLNDGTTMTGTIAVNGSATLNLLDNSSAEILGNLDLSYGPIKFYTENGTYKVDYYATADASEAITATVLISAPFVVKQSGNTTTNTITVTDWDTAVPLDLTIDGLNIETSTALSKDDNAGHIDINGSAVRVVVSERLPFLW